MNDERLSAHEHAELRDIVLTGARRIRPAGAHRAQFAAAAIALVLVGGIAGGAIATGALRGGEVPPATTASPTPSTTATPTPTPTPTPTTPPAPPAEGVLAFGGQCAAVVTDEEVGAALGRPMARNDEPWLTGAYRALGGLDCFWTSSDEYNAAAVRFVAYPADVVPETVLTAAAAGGCPPEWTPFGCAVAGVVGDTWIMVSASDTASDTADATQALYDLAADRVARHSAAVAPARTAQWWTLPPCADLVGRLDAAALGYDRIEITERVADMQTSPGDATQVPEVAGTSRWCEMQAVRDGQPDGWANIFIEMVAGGGLDFGTVAAAAVSPVQIAGAQAAYVVHDNSRLDGGSDLLALTDGTNVLTVRGADQVSSDPEAFAGFAAAILAAIESGQ